MKDLKIIVYTMKNCPYCVEFKNLLQEKKIEFFDRDIEEYESEYNLFSKITNNDMVPALLIIEGDDKDHNSFIYVPDKDYNELIEAYQIIKKHQKNLGII